MVKTEDFSSLHEYDIHLTSVGHARFRSIIGVLIYTAICTHSDIISTGSVLARHMHNPSIRHLVLVKRLVRHLLGTRELALFYPSRSSSALLTAFSDSDWARFKEKRKVISAFFVTVNGAAVIWYAKRQNLVVVSSAEAE